MSNLEYDLTPILNFLSFQWMRAKTVQKVLAVLKGPKKTTKELLDLSRRLGFSILDSRGELVAFAAVKCPFDLRLIFFLHTLYLYNVCPLMARP